MDRSLSHFGVSVIMQGEAAGTGGLTVVKYQIQTRTAAWHAKSKQLTSLLTENQTTHLQPKN